MQWANSTSTQLGSLTHQWRIGKLEKSAGLDCTWLQAKMLQETADRLGHHSGVKKNEADRAELAEIV